MRDEFWHSVSFLLSYFSFLLFILELTPAYEMVLPTYRVLFSQLTSLKILSQTGLGVCLQMILIPVNFTSKINHQSFFIIIMFIMFICFVCVCLCTCTSVCAL